MDLGSTIARLRAKQGLSQGDLAEALGVSRQSVSKWETNASVPEVEKLVRMSHLFHVTLDELVTGEAPPASVQTAPPDTKPPRQGHRVAGTILLCMAFLVWLLLTFLGSFLGGLLLALPFFLCGLICLFCRKRAGLFCAWIVYLYVECYLRFATGLSWEVTLWTLRFTPEMNYMRLAIAWAQLLAMLGMFALTIFSFRTVRLTRRREWIGVLCLFAVWAALRWGTNALFAWLYQGPELIHGMGISLLAAVLRTARLPLFAAALTAAACALPRREKTNKSANGDR